MSIIPLIITILYFKMQVGTEAQNKENKEYVTFNVLKADVSEGMFLTVSSAQCCFHGCICFAK